MTPSKFFLTKGVGVHREKLSSFELALREAGMAPFNLVSVSSILPPGCKKVTREKGLTFLNHGEVVFCVMAKNETNESNRLISASVGCAIPVDHKARYGYLSEHHSFGETEKKAGEYAEDLAASMLASTLGIKFNPDDAWDTRRQAYKLSRKIVYTSNITQTARGNKDGLWTSVVAAVIFIP
ncbi:MAG: arginine decarboxylase, pyruvoyl-dependent [Candidatus Nealsonbacteria bacterium CG_4_10_14_0_2_um_filter_38_17]|uniref:Pyruvoyl-dependent arginine decarboxylase AaxB n=1 Tax=Candidatus Nealsonbacteria bacterium CG_4_10_14_0_2_um_filter_38_17 TaxID=1974680 RepID=A0A2M7UXK9_9BACT|nr:MAG: arginine decarboxylase, pyruvoyl-dependent [Candidatus Nealsonbacteria bacterium CG_4_10_14_0_2_um_filter_38_17]